MTRSALRIRHYIGTIVAACSLGGLLLAFELAYLFQSLEHRSSELRTGSTTLSTVVALQGGVESWLEDLRLALGDAQRVQAAEERQRELLLQMAKLEDESELPEVRAALEQARAELKDALQGPKLTLR